MSTPIEKLEDNAAEEGNYPVEFSFYDEDDAVVTPNASTVSWELFDSSDTSLAEGDLDSAEEMVVLLVGDHLAISTTPDTYKTIGTVSIPLYLRRLTIQGVVDSDIGTNIPVNKEYIFYIEGMVGIV